MASINRSFQRSKISTSQHRGQPPSRLSSPRILTLDFQKLLIAMTTRVDVVARSLRNVFPVGVVEVP